MTESDRTDRDYTERLGRVLAQRDPGALKDFLVESARRFGDEVQVTQITQQSDTDLEVMMHRMIVSRPDLAALHAESRAWLQAHGFDSPSGASGPRRAPVPPSRPRQRKPR